MSQTNVEIDVMLIEPKGNMCLLQFDPCSIMIENIQFTQKTHGEDIEMFVVVVA